MTFPVSIRLFLLALCLQLTPHSFGADAPPPIEDVVSDAELHQGYFDFYYQPSSGELFLRVDRFDEDFLYASALSTGIGSNDIGLDRGQIGGSRVVRFERFGNKVFLKQLNLGYRADSDNQAEKLAVEEAFAESVLAGFTIVAISGNSVLINMTDFLLTDVHGVTATLSRSQQGNFSVDKQRSAIYPDRTRNFPLNSEFEVLLTFAGNQPGNLVRSVTPSPDSISLRQHHSFVQLPEPGYEPRLFHPESGFWSRSFEDFAAPINEDMTRRYISRHRLQKRNPDASRSEPIKPVIYYLDPGVPEPVRSALLDGARWWSDAFEAIGFENAFQVELLPEDADPMDIRYNVIQWVHRSTRGWSYGSSVTDPRTGEIIKGKVTLGSLRVRQDYRIAQSLIGLALEGSDEAIQELALSRIRQLSAHEVGHTLGIAHNFASSVNQRASVMDYPHPLLEFGDRELIDALNAYDIGLGQWDHQVIEYGYTEYPDPITEAIGLTSTLQDNRDAGLYFISDRDSRAPGGAHPLSHMWDNGADPVAELDRLLNVRQVSMQRFGADNLHAGQPFSELEEILVPLYFLHRYQVEAVHRMIGGTYYEYAVFNGENADTNQVIPVSAEQQMAAMDSLLKTLEPETLALSPDILRLIPPKALGFSRSPESFPLRTSQGMDYTAIAETAADHTVSGLLQRERLARINNLHGLYPELPGVSAILQRLLEQSWFHDKPRDQLAYVQRAVDNVVLYRLLELLSSQQTDTQVRAAVNLALHTLEAWLEESPGDNQGIEWQAHYQLALDAIAAVRSGQPIANLLTAPLPMPPGAPI